jgi:hypothetical protein
MAETKGKVETPDELEAWRIGHGAEEEESDTHAFHGTGLFAAITTTRRKWRIPSHLLLQHQCSALIHHGVGTPEKHAVLITKVPSCPIVSVSSTTTPRHNRVTGRRRAFVYFHLTHIYIGPSFSCWLFLSFTTLLAGNVLFQTHEQSQLRLVVRRLLQGHCLLPSSAAPILPTATITVIASRIIAIVTGSSPTPAEPSSHRPTALLRLSHFCTSAHAPFYGP